ncbi:hypothetical protein [Pseudodesulfovibrio senegalensis]|jgi:hypothetical protein|uniref:Uncharacterized protein n=1 Tax=Pseudodesulfovibrio senegalensis TaxID=1721087 RepID=A0A6N6N742_9BACT|nr:hypothetical protein [Pseudodesulfovibrio senegalensis]KAB1442917.1 hypothetical protein F8A88_01180 [Pseudodesulfovibrio senegalensis]
MSNSKYSVLFMRDDTDVKRYRLSPFWLRLFFFSQIFMLLCAGGGMYMGLRGWWQNAELLAQKKNLEQRLVDAEVRLERLGNMEKILQSYDPKELQALLSSASEETPVNQPSLDLRKIFSRVDTRQVGVENLQARISGSKASVSFELNNMQTTKSMAGVVDFAFVKKNGEEVTIKTNKNDLTFQIQRFKRIRTSFIMPNGVKKEDVFGIRLEIRDNDGTVIFSETYPLYNILA